MNIIDRIGFTTTIAATILVTVWMISSVMDQAKANDDYQRGLTVSGIDVMCCSQISHDAGLTGRAADEATFTRLKQWQAERAAKYAKDHK